MYTIGSAVVMWSIDGWNPDTSGGAESKREFHGYHTCFGGRVGRKFEQVLVVFSVSQHFSCCIMKGTLDCVAVLYTR